MLLPLHASFQLLRSLQISSQLMPTLRTSFHFLPPSHNLLWLYFPHRLQFRSYCHMRLPSKIPRFHFSWSFLWRLHFISYFLHTIDFSCYVPHRLHFRSYCHMHLHCRFHFTCQFTDLNFHLHCNSHFSCSFCRRLYHKFHFICCRFHMLFATYTADFIILYFHSWCQFSLFTFKLDFVFCSYRLHHKLHFGSYVHEKLHSSCYSPHRLHSICDDHVAMCISFWLWLCSQISFHLVLTSQISLKLPLPCFVSTSITDESLPLLILLQFLLPLHISFQLLLVLQSSYHFNC